MVKRTIRLTALFITAYALIMPLGCTNEDGTLPPDEDNSTYVPNTDGSYWTYTYQRYQNNVPTGEPYLFTREFDGSSVLDGETVQNFKRTVEGATEYEVFLVKDNETNTYSEHGIEYYDGTDSLTDSVYFDPAWTIIQYPLSVGMNWQVINVTGISPLAVGLPADIDNDGKDDTLDVEINCSTVVKGDVTTVVGIFNDAYKVNRDIYITYYLTQGGESKLAFEQDFWFKPEKGTVKMSGDEIGYPNGPRYTFEASLTEYEIVPESGR